MVFQFFDLRLKKHTQWFFIFRKWPEKWYTVIFRPLFWSKILIHSDQLFCRFLQDWSLLSKIWSGQKKKKWWTWWCSWSSCLWSCYDQKWNFWLKISFWKKSTHMHAHMTRTHKGPGRKISKNRRRRKIDRKSAICRRSQDRSIFDPQRYFDRSIMVDQIMIDTLYHFRLESRISGLWPVVVNFRLNWAWISAFGRLGSSFRIFDPDLRPKAAKGSSFRIFDPESRTLSGTRSSLRLLAATMRS